MADIFEGDSRLDRRDAVPGKPGIAHSAPGPSGLKSALRRARIESAERSDVLIELRGAEQTRLEILAEHLEPVFAEIPEGCDLFDPAIAPGERPRLFIDMVAFVEMGRDRRTYQFVQDSRLGRTVLAESERVDAIVKAVTDYMARRLIEREKALCSVAAASRALLPEGHAGVPGAPPSEPARFAPPRPRPTAGRILARTFLFVVELVGSAVIFAALVAAGYWAWQRYAPVLLPG